MRGTHKLETPEGGRSKDTERKQLSEHTHKLEMAEGGTSQDTETKQLSNWVNWHSQTGDGRETSQDTERKQLSKGNSLSGDSRL